MAVVPKTDRLSLNRLKPGAEADSAESATEVKFRDRFPVCETGAMPPFGNLYDLPVIADKRLAANDTIAFDAGTHTEAYSMARDDFERLVKPKIAALKA
jgi:Ala-tRNA(Pro) deacylase